MERRGRGGFGRDRRGGGGGGGYGGGGGGYGGGGGGFGHDRFDRPKPIKIGEEYDVTITDIGSKGDGITKVENFVVFVNGGKKGEQCRIRIREVANKFAIADKVGASEQTEEAEQKESSSESEETQEEDSSEGSEKESDED